MLSVVTGMLLALMTQRCLFLRHDSYLRDFRQRPATLHDIAHSQNARRSVQASKLASTLCYTAWCMLGRNVATANCSVKTWSTPLTCTRVGLLLCRALLLLICAPSAVAHNHICCSSYWPAVPIAVRQPSSTQLHTCQRSSHGVAHALGAWMLLQERRRAGHGLAAPRG